MFLRCRIADISRACVAHIPGVRLSKHKPQGDKARQKVVVCSVRIVVLVASKSVKIKGIGRYGTRTVADRIKVQSRIMPWQGKGRDEGTNFCRQDEQRTAR